MRPMTVLLPALAAVLLAVAACGGGKTSSAGGTPATDAPPPPEGGRVAALACTSETASGDWRTATGSDFETITLNADGSFSSFLHDRPFSTGTWRVDAGAVVLESSDGATTRIEGARCAGQLFGQLAGGGELRWERIAHAGEVCQKACANVHECDAQNTVEDCLQGCDDRDPITRCLAERPDCPSRQNCYGL